MNTRNDTGFRTFLVGSGGVTRNTRVKTPAAIVTAGAGEDSIGIALETVAAGGYCAVKLFSAPGTFACVAAGPVTASAPVYGAASGKIDDAVSGNKIGTALEAAAADGDVIEFLPANVGDLFAVQAHVADAVTLTDNTGQSGTHDDTLAATTAPAKFTGTVTGTANDVLEDIAAASGACGGSATPSATDVNTAIATAVAPIVTGLNLQVKEFYTKVNAIIDLQTVQAQNASDTAQKVIELVTKVNTILASLEANGIHLSA